MKSSRSKIFVFLVANFSLLAGLASFHALAQAPANSSSSFSSSSAATSGQGSIYAREKAPSLIDPAGPTISLIPSEPVFVMAAALNACGYDEGLEQSDPIRKHIRDEMNQALAKSEDARARRDAICLYIAQHRMTGSERDIAQYISLALYLTAPPELEITADLTEMPPDATQVAEIVPLLRSFVAAVDLHGIWLASHHLYDEAADKIHDPLSQMIVNTNIYLKMPAATYSGSRFIVVIEPQFSPAMVTKSGVMVGLGESMDELIEVFRDLGEREVDILTVGQYLRPSRDHLPIARFYAPDEFRILKQEALRFGFSHVESGPLVRSSYHAHEQAATVGR